MDQNLFDELPSDSSEEIFESIPLTKDLNKKQEETLYTKLFGKIDDNTTSTEDLWTDSESDSIIPIWSQKKPPLLINKIYKKTKSYKINKIEKLFESNFFINSLFLINPLKENFLCISKNSFIFNSKEYKTDFIISDCLLIDSFILFISLNKLFLFNGESFKIINKPFNEKGFKKIIEIIINNKKYIAILGFYLNILSFDTFDILLSIKIPNIIDLCILNESNKLFILTNDSIFEINLILKSFNIEYKSKKIITNLYNPRSIYFNYGYLIIILKNCIKLLENGNIIKTFLLKKNFNNSLNLIRFYSYDYLLFISLDGNLKIINLKKKIFLNFIAKSNSLIGYKNKIYLSVKRSVILYEITE